MLDFTYEALPARVIFAVGALDRIADEVAAMGGERALVLCTPEQKDQAEDVSARLGERSVGVYDGAIMHVPIECARAGITEAGRRDADCCVAVGGGSTIGLGKAIALESELPILVFNLAEQGNMLKAIQGRQIGTLITVK